MVDDELRYDLMVEDAKRGVVRQVLTQVAEHGLPGEHHLYITFRTGHPDVVMPDHLRARYPGEMTIVLQHQFEDLEVWPDAFGVTLSFSNVRKRLTVPFESVAAFADPTVRFDLQFDIGARDQSPGGEDPIALGEAVPPEAEAANLKAVPKHSDSAGETAADPDKVVTLDTFRRARET